jgi:hypothetical protein
MTDDIQPPVDAQAALDERNRIARESIEKAQAMWQRRLDSLRPLPRIGAMEALHASLRERNATSIFGKEMAIQPGDKSYIRLPSVHGDEPLPDYVAAALITFLRRGARARAGTLVSDGKPVEASNDAV